MTFLDSTWTLTEGPISRPGSNNGRLTVPYLASMKSQQQSRSRLFSSASPERHLMWSITLASLWKRSRTQGRIIAALKCHVDGQVNETIERRNLRRRTQQEGESFDDFLVSLRELAKTCNFCNNECLQRALRDQIIEGLRDGEIIQELLQTRELTLDQAITKCRGLEAAKQSRRDIEGSLDINVFRSRPRTGISSAPGASTCAGCGGTFHEGGRKKCPAYNQICRKCNKTGHFGRVCRQKLATNPRPQGTSPQANILTLPPHDLPLVQLSNTTLAHAPTIKMHVATCHGQADIHVLPDSGADICAAGPQFVTALGEYLDNLAHSDVTPRAVNGTTLQPLGMIPDVKFTPMVGQPWQMCTSITLYLEH